MIDYLKTYREEMPQWLKDYKTGDFVPFSDFMAGRVGYYPGRCLGGNYDRFGRGGILDKIIIRSGLKPEFIILGHSTALWEGYERVSGAREVRGGMHESWRSLYKTLK